jgi:hypothetical protein
MEMHKSVLERFDSKLWGHHFKVSQVLGDSFVEGNNRRVLCTINGKLEFPCALMPFGEGGYFININKEIRVKLNLKIGESLSFSLSKDDSEYGMPMPEEMSELLKIDDEANEYFHSLTPGKQRNLIYLVAKPKSSAIRLNKALGITEFLKYNTGVLDFKLMNSYLKDFNKL